VRDALKGSPPIDQRDFLATRILDDLSAFRREGPAASAGGQGRERTHPERDASDAGWYPTCGGMAYATA
jgi:hypothetical protein